MQYKKKTHPRTSTKDIITIHTSTILNGVLAAISEILSGLLFFYSATMHLLIYEVINRIIATNMDA